MKTHRSDGTPYGFDCLLNAFWLRMTTMQELAEFATNHDGATECEKAIAAGLSMLREDWERCEGALREWHDREHPVASGSEVAR